MTLDSLAGVVAVRNVIEDSLEEIGISVVEFWGDLDADGAEEALEGENPGYALLDDQSGSSTTITNGGHTRARPRVQLDIVAPDKTRANRAADRAVEIIEAAEISVAIAAGANTSKLRRADGTWRVNHPTPQPFDGPNVYRITLLFEWGELRSKE